jgi:hypothetical protein
MFDNAPPGCCATPMCGGRRGAGRGIRSPEPEEHGEQVVRVGEAGTGAPWPIGRAPLPCSRFAAECSFDFFHQF